LVRHGDEGEAMELQYAAPDDVEENFARGERRRLVEEALRQLPSAQRVPLVLFHLEGMKYEEIAAKLGVSLGKVKTDIFRARAVLRKKLEPRLRVEGRPGE
jgi:RNA polymerase sigma-70 factor (ECF subfamily)